MPNFLSTPGYYTSSRVFVKDQFDVYSTGETEVSLGKNANAEGVHGVAIGAGASAPNDSGTAVGYQANVRDDYCTAIGANAGAEDEYSVAVGAEAVASSGDGTPAIQIGKNSVSYPTNLINFGDKSFIKLAVDLVYPVGSIYMSVNSANPASLFGGTWVAWGSGRAPVGVNASDSDFGTVEKTGGAKSVAFTPSISTTTTEGGTGGYPAVSSVSANQSTVSVLQPYITCYMWKRTN